jgi:hypothetical protein
MGRIRASFEIMRSSWGVLRQDKELLWLPVCSFAATLVSMALFLGGVLAVNGGLDAVDGEAPSNPLTWVLGFLLWVVLAIITVFFNAAMVSAANERMTGGDPTFETALAGAMARIGPIVVWGLISATVSQVLRSLQERAGLLGRIAIGIVGMAWALVTFLVIPVLVIEGAGVGEAVKRSKDLFRRTWGEQVVGNATIGLGSFLLVVAAAPVVVLFVITGVTPLVVTGVVLGVLWVAAVATVSTALSGIFQTALYRYASTGDIPSGYQPDVFEAAFRPRRSGMSGRLLGR